MLPSILIVDDERDVLKALERLLRKDFQLYLFTEPLKALAFFRNTPTHIVISDMQMPEMNGAEFLKLIAKENSRSKRVVLTGFADIELAQQAINDGHISFYLNKPWENAELKQTLESLIVELKKENRKQAFVKKLTLDKQKLIHVQQENVLMQNLMQAEHDDNVKQMAQLKKINNELLFMNANMIAMSSNEYIGHSLRIAQQAKVVAKRLALDEISCLNIYLAGLFHRIGLSMLGGQEDMQPIKSMSVQERLSFESYVQQSAQIMASSTLLAASTVIVKHIFESINGKGIPDKLPKHDIPLGSRILRVAIMFDLIVHGQYQGYVVQPLEAIEILRAEVGNTIDGSIFNCFIECIEQPNNDERFELVKSVQQLDVGYEICHDIVDEHHHKILSESTVLTQAIIMRLQSIQQQMSKPLLVYVKSQKSELNHG